MLFKAIQAQSNPHMFDLEVGLTAKRHQPRRWLQPEHLSSIGSPSWNQKPLLLLESLEKLVPRL